MRNRRLQCDTPLGKVTPFYIGNNNDNYIILMTYYLRTKTKR